MIREKPTYWHNIEKIAPEWQGYVHELEEFDLARLNRVGPVSYQNYLYALIRHFNPKVIVETGVRSGPSTVITYAAMDIPDSHLYSCDPCFVSQEAAAAKVKKATGMVLVEEGWTFIPEKSESAFDKMPEKWDFFIHDSDHGYKNMMFELNAAWDRLNPGGVLVCDDFEKQPACKSHRGFFEFCERVGVEYLQIGSAAFVVKPEESDPEESEEPADDSAEGTDPLLS